MSSPPAIDTMDAASTALVPLPPSSPGESSTLILDSDPLAHFRKSASDYAKEARSVATQRAYSADWRDFERWCKTLSLVQLWPPAATAPSCSLVLPEACAVPSWPRCAARISIGTAAA